MVPGHLRLQDGRRDLARVDDVGRVGDARTATGRRIVRVRRCEGVSVPHLDQLVLGASDEKPVIEPEVQDRVIVCPLDLVDLLPGGESPDDDILVTAAGDDDVLLRPGVKLEAEHRFCVADQRPVEQSLGVQVPNSHGPITASTDQPSSRELDRIDAFLVGFVHVRGMRQLESREATFVPILFQTPPLTVQMGPVDLGETVETKEEIGCWRRERVRHGPHDVRLRIAAAAAATATGASQGLVFRRAWETAVDQRVAHVIVPLCIRFHQCVRPIVLE